MGQMGKLPWQCTTTGLDNSIELRMEKIRQAVTEIWVPQVWQPPARPPARPPEPWRQYPSSPKGWGVKIYYQSNIGREDGLAAFSTGIYTVLILTILSRQLRKIYLEYILCSMETYLIIWRAIDVMVPNALRNIFPLVGLIIFNFTDQNVNFLSSD